MNVGVLLPGFSSDEGDWAIPVQLNLVRVLAKQEDVRVLALRYPHRRDCYPVYGATIYSLGVGQVRGWRRLALWWDALETLLRLHREKPFDVLHAMWADETGLIAAWAGRRLNIPVVVSIAGGELARLDDIGYGLGRSAFSRWIVGQALHRADRVVVACSSIRRMIAEAGYQVAESNIHTIVLGVDTAVFYPSVETRTMSSRQNRRLIHVASLVRVKDQATLLRAMARLDSNITLDMIGVGPERPRLELLAAELGITGQVNFVGGVLQLDLPRYYQNAALNVLSSRHEGLGMVTLEAAACGLPTVGTAVGLLPDYPALGVSVRVGDDSALAAAIRKLLEDDGRRIALAQSAYETIRARFTIQHTVGQFRALYRDLLR